MEAVTRRFVLLELKNRGQSPTNAVAFFQFLKEIFHLEDVEDDKKEPLQSLKSAATVVTSKLRGLMGSTRGKKRTSFQNVVKKVGSFNNLHKAPFKKVSISVIF